MRATSVGVSFLAIAGFIDGSLLAQDPPEREYVFCDPADPRNGCSQPGPECFCGEDSLEITFDGDSDCQDALDSDDDGRVSITDAIWTLRFLYRDGLPPPAPFPDCGRDPTPEDAGLGCRESICGG